MIMVYEGQYIIMVYEGLIYDNGL